MKPSGAFVIALAGAVLISAVSVVYVKHRSRVLFVELTTLERDRDRLDVEWSQLAIERSSLAAHDRIEGMARDSLEFVAPDSSNTQVVVAR